MVKIYLLFSVCLEYQPLRITKRKINKIGLPCLNRLFLFSYTPCYCAGTIYSCSTFIFSLGKTIQVIAFLSGMYDAQKIRNVLIVLPVAVIINWQREFEKW